MTLSKFRTQYKNLKPYSNQDYIRDAKSIILNRILAGRFDHNQAQGDNVRDSKHAAQWSAISRKRKSGIMLLALYDITIKYDLDMTTTLAQRILQGIFGSSISNGILLVAFAQKGRTASDKSEDWERLEAIIKESKPYYVKKMAQAKERLIINKEAAWDRASDYLKLKK